MPRLCASLKWLFTEHRFLERFSAAAHAGFTAVEYASPYEHSVSELRERLKSYQKGRPDNSAYIGYQLESYEKQFGRGWNWAR
jgi:hypothetical protein